MHLTGEVDIGAARTRVWAALNDPHVLARCIEGVEQLERVTGAEGEGDRFAGRMNAKVGPVRATFTGQVTLRDVVAPESYVLAGEGKGGVAGFARGEAKVSLEELGSDATRLRYAVDSTVGGKLAQLGARLIEGTARGYAEAFFARLKAEVESPVAAPTEVTPAAETPVEESPGAAGRAGSDAASPAEIAVATPARGLPPYLWGGGLVLLVLLFLLWQWG